MGDEANNYSNDPGQIQNIHSGMSVRQSASAVEHRELIKFTKTPQKVRLDASVAFNEENYLDDSDFVLDI